MSFVMLKSNRVSDQKRREYKDFKLRTKYGISLLQMEEMYKKQNGICPICKVEMVLLVLAVGNKTKYTLPSNIATVDHCHKTKKVRALLCSNCNRGLGSFKDSVETLVNAVIYLQSHS